jgi:hypothetical protein
VVVAPPVRARVSTSFTTSANRAITQAIETGSIKSDVSFFTFPTFASTGHAVIFSAFKWSEQINRWSEWISGCEPTVVVSLRNDAWHPVVQSLDYLIRVCRNHRKSKQICACLPIFPSLLQPGKRIRLSALQRDRERLLRLVFNSCRS